MLCNVHTQSWDIQGSYGPLQQAPSIASLATKREACTAKVCLAKGFEQAVRQPAGLLYLSQILAARPCLSPGRGLPDTRSALKVDTQLEVLYEQ